MTKRNTLLSCLFLLAGIATAQPLTTPSDIVLTAKDSSNGGLVPRRLITTRDGNFLQAGSDGVKGYLSKINSCGRVLWTKQYLLGDETDLNAVVELPSGEIAATGSCRNCAPADTAQKALLLKTDAAGLLLLDTTFGNTNYNAVATDLVLAGSDKIALSIQTTFAGIFIPADAVLAVLDQQLTLQLWKPLHQFYVNFGAALTPTTDGGFVVAGYSVPVFLAPHQAQVFRLDAGGNLLWKYTAPHLNSRFADIVQATDGRLIAFGNRKVDDLSGYDLYLAVFDQYSGALLSEKTYGSPADDTGKSLEKIDGGYLAGAIFGQPAQPGYGMRDWVFRLDDQFNIVQEYLRDGYLFGHLLVNAIPLSSDGRSFAYHSRLAFFTNHSTLFFKRTFPGDRAVLSRAPQHYQLVPRNLATNKGTVVIAGTMPAAGVYDAMQLEVLRNAAPYLVLTDDSPQTFEFKPEIPAELAEFSFRLSGLNNQTAYFEAEACEIVAGDAYLIQGQSNAVAGLPYDPENAIDHAYRHHKTPFVRNFGLKYAKDTLWTWRKESGETGDYADNISGQWGLILGKNIAETYGVPVAIFNGAISGIAIDTMMPDPVNPADPGTRFGRFLQRVERSGLRDHVRGMLMFQGETNAGAAFWDGAADYYQKFETLDNAWKLAFPALQQRYLFQIRPGGYWIGATLLTCLQVSEAQRRVAEHLPGWQIMSSTGMNHDSTHYFYQNGYERAGHDIFRLVAQDLYGAPELPDVHPPTPGSLRFAWCDQTKILLQLRHPDDTYLWTPGWESDFRLEGATHISVTAGALSGNTLTLTLSGTPGAGFTGLSYTAHPGGSAAPVKNANGIGMLTFYKLPVSPGSPVVLSDTTIQGDNGSGNGAIEVNISGGTAPYTYLWSTGSSSSAVSLLVAGTYTVTITDTDLCSQSFELTVPMLVAVSAGAHAQETHLFPNPCSDYVDLHLPELAAGARSQIRLSDALGREVLPVFEPTGERTRVYTALLPPGLYSLRLYIDGVLYWSGVVVKQ